MWWAMRERKPGLLSEKFFHAVGVAGENHDQIVAMVLHHLQQDFDRLLAVVALVVGLVKIIGLVDEQHAAHRLFQHFAGFRRRMADILADEVVTRHRDEMPLAHIAEPMQQAGHLQRHGGLADAGIAGEAHVQGRRLARKPKFLPRAVDQQQRRGLADALLDRREADQVPVEFVQNFGDAGGAEVGGEIDEARGFRACFRWSRCFGRSWPRPFVRAAQFRPEVVMAVPGLDPGICSGHPRGAAACNDWRCGSLLSVEDRHRAEHDGCRS